MKTLSLIMYSQNWSINGEEVPMFGGFLVGVGIITALAILLGVYIYTSWAWYKIAKKTGFADSWLAWVPLGREAMILYLGGKWNWGWIFLILIPIVGWLFLWIILIISVWHIFEKLGYAPWLSLTYATQGLIDSAVPGLGTVFYYSVLAVVAWGRPDWLPVGFEAEQKTLPKKEDEIPKEE